MLSARLVLSILLLVAVAGALWWTAALGPGGTNDQALVTGPFDAYVVGPEGEPLGNGTVLARGTPLDVLDALAATRGFGVEVDQQTWVGSGCTAAYVVGIAGHRETGTGGWNYYTRQVGQDWAWRSAGAACYRLSAGEQVEWCWVEADACRHHVP
ncbi:MAG: hypothetical protein QOC71_858 [Thermoplasmata archaeon]|nr:hypothetical protein [Thermoplasmata archaeon]